MTLPLWCFHISTSFHESLFSGWNALYAASFAANLSSVSSSERNRPCSDVANFFRRFRGNPSQLVWMQYSLDESFAECSSVEEQSLYSRQMQDIQPNHPVSRLFKSAAGVRSKARESNERISKLRIRLVPELGPLDPAFPLFAGLAERVPRNG